MAKADAAGVVEALEPGIRRVLAPNPSPMTYHGTNTYLIGAGDVAVVDPGPDSAPHLVAIQAALAPGERITQILVTHSHVDHSPLARPLAKATGAPVLAYGDSRAGQTEVMAQLAADGLTGGGEGVDHGFHPDETLRDGETFKVGGTAVTALWTPGHMANHLSFQIGDAVLTGDLVMGWASTMVSPPDGDLEAFLASTRRLEALDARVFYPGHGAPVHDPSARCAWLIAHRAGREAQILAALQAGSASVSALTAGIYTDVPPALLPAAERNVFAHLIALVGQHRVTAKPLLAVDAEFSLKG